jgi:hypothetical protein
MGKENDTFKFRLNDDGVTCMKFKCNADDPIIKLKEEEPLGTWIELEMVVKVNMNVFNSIASPQAVIQDYNLVKRG